ncbi:MAG: hypothetical protein IPG45_13295 [Deltaproteobacteria bacterium]|nr:hypothetical protein [Deltaproteobacteria bacterium]
MARTLFALTFGLALAGCGGNTLTQPQDLPTKVYPADTAFRLTLVMKTCSDSCATYEAGECSVEVEGNTLTVDASISYERTGENCTERCGTPVLVHCEVGKLAAGEYTVEADGFTRQITVR